MELFPRLQIRSGGVRSGFTHVEEQPKEEVTTLLRVFKVPGAKRELRKTIGRVGTIDDILGEISSGYGLDREDHAQIFAIGGGGDFVEALRDVHLPHPEPEALSKCLWIAALDDDEITRRSKALEQT